MALSCAFVDLGAENPKAKVMTSALDKAVGPSLTTNKIPSGKVNEIDNRRSHYGVARYWADELSRQDDDKKLKTAFTEASRSLADGESTSLDELVKCQGKPVDLGGYYKVDKAKVDEAIVATHLV